MNNPVTYKIIGDAVFILVILLAWRTLIQQLKRQGEEIWRMHSRMHFLNTLDWAYARHKNIQLVGLAYLIPEDILRSARPIHISNYFTEAEIKTFLGGIELIETKEDKRKERFAKSFVY